MIVDDGDVGNNWIELKFLRLRGFLGDAGVR